MWEVVSLRSSGRAKFMGCALEAGSEVWGAGGMEARRRGSSRHVLPERPEPRRPTAAVLLQAGPLLEKLP